jgi:nitrate reductase gamma subunit
MPSASPPSSNGWQSSSRRAGVFCYRHDAADPSPARLADPQDSSFGDIAILLLLYAQLILGLGTIFVSLQHLDGHEMVKFMTWAQGILTLQPGVADLIADAHPIFKAHLFLGMTLFLVFPFTRLVHVWARRFGIWPPRLSGCAQRWTARSSFARPSVRRVSGCPARCMSSFRRASP